MAYVDFVGKLHNKTKRDYVQRVIENDKSECAEVAKKYGQDYWDGDRKHGYGGYKYDGRWLSIAEDLAKHFNIKPGDKILDIGCGKGYLLHEFTQAVPGVEVSGLDISPYAIENAKEEVKPFLKEGHAKSLPYEDNSFDVVVSLGALHNLKLFELFNAVKEISRVAKSDRNYIMLESWRNEKERANLLYWQLTCESFYDVETWEKIYEYCGYKGDWDFIFFE